MRNIRYIGTKPSEDAFSRDTGIVWFPNKVDTVLSDEIAERMLRHPEFQDAGDAKGVSGVADTDVPTPGVGGAGVSDGDKGDVVVSGTGTVWTVEANAISNTKLSDVPTATFKGRNTAGTGDPQDLTVAQALALLGVAAGATANSPDAALLSRSNHTGTQLAATVSDFSEAVDDRVAALLAAGTNVTLTYNDATGQLTISAAGGGGGVADDPVTLTGNTTLTWPDAQGKYYSVNSASAVALTLPSGVGTNAVKIVGVNVGAGALSFVAGGGESILAHAILPSTVDQYSPFELRRFGSVWVRVA